MSNAESRADDCAASWGSCLAIELNDFIPISGADAYSIFRETFDVALTPAFLQSMTDADYERLASTARDYLETPTIGMAQMRRAVAATIWHGTDSSSDEDSVK